jgi:putative endonuclease
MFYVYILQSICFNRYYVGHSADVRKRLNEHNACKVRSIKAFAPWKIVYTEILGTKSDAFKMEMEIKSYKSGKAFQKLINLRNPI